MFFFRKFKFFCLLAGLSLWMDLCAVQVDFNKIFNGKTGCFILFDLDANKTVLRYNETVCSEQLSPCSTFKIPLALMAYDQGVLEDETSPVMQWDGVKRAIPDWNKDQTPVTWEKYSVVWVSQRITSKIGMEKIKTYLSDFKYGNQDMSGGITSSWLTSSLKISANGQIDFLKLLWFSHLKVSSQAVEHTKNIIPSEKLESGIIYGKTGSGILQAEEERLGWYVGYFVNRDKHYVFALNFKDAITSAPGGFEAKQMSKEILINFISVPQ